MRNLEQHLRQQQVDFKEHLEYNKANSRIKVEKMRVCFISTLIVIVFLFTACSTPAPSSYDSVRVEASTESSASTPAGQLNAQAAEAVKATEADDGAAGQSIWDELGLIQENPCNVACYSFDAIAPDQDMPAILMDGLSHKNPVVQWFCAYKSIDWLDEMDPAELKTRLTSLRNSKEGYVRDAAGLALAVLNKDWNYPHILKSPKKDRYAFTCFNDSQANDGAVFIVEDNQLKKVNLDINTYVSGWSPDGNWLVCNSIYRYGNVLQLLNVETGNAAELTGNIIEGFSDMMPRLALNPPDVFSDLSLLEWSPDSKKVLLSYRYIDIQMCDAWIIMVCDFQSNTVDWITTYSDEEQNSRFLVDGAAAALYTPDGFNWEAEDYGLPGGMLTSVPPETSLARANLAVQRFLKSISDNDFTVFKSFIPSEKRLTKSQMQAVLDDFRICFGNKPVGSYKYCGLNPKAINSFKYSAENEMRGGVYLYFTMDSNGSFTCSHPFIDYSQAVRKLADEYAEALRHEDIEALTRILSMKAPVTEQQVRKMADIYKQMLDISKATVVFSGQTAGDSERGIFYYELRNDAGNIISGININYVDGKLYLIDSMLEQKQ